MRYVFVALVMLVAGASAQKSRKSDLEVTEAKCRRGEETVTLDGKLRINAEKPIRGLVLAIDFLGSSGDVLTTQKAELSDEPVKRDEEPPFHLETNNPPGAIKVRVRAYDSENRELRVANSGPFVIE